MAQTRMALNILCEDKVGLVARLTRVLADRAGNIEELYQGVLRGYFTLTMLVTFREEVDPGALRSALEEVAQGGAIEVGILPRRERSLPPAAEGIGFVLSVEGADEPGIAGALTGFLADRQINIEDLSANADGGRFTITARLTIPRETDVRALRSELAEILKPRNAEASLMHENIFAATSTIDPPAPARDDKP